LVSVLTRVLARALGLPPALTTGVDITRDLRVPMPDGAELLTDLYVPRRVPNAPTVLIRSPYGRRGLFGLLNARVLAERGFQVVIQSVRGTAGSGGTLDPFAQERADGLATLDWVERQPWFHGNLLTFGASYLGYVQWALAADAGDRVAAMCASVTASQFRGQTYAGESYSLDATLSWTAMMSRQTGRPLRDAFAMLRPDRRLAAAMNRLPLSEADVVATGRQAAHFQEWLEHGKPGDPYWTADRDHDARLAGVSAPVSMVAGWHDLFLPWQLDDYEALRAAGREPYITIGPWTHTDPKNSATALREAIAWFTAHVTGRRERLRAQPVRLYVQGAGEWRDYERWPPPGSTPATWHLHAGGRLSARLPEASAPSRYRYDPADPTPALGGPLLGVNAGRFDNRPLEERLDVLVFTGDALDAPVEVIGPVGAVIHLRSSNEHTDVFVRVCDVDPSGRSTNVCDGIQRITSGGFPAGADGVRTVAVRLWPTAYRFGAGHRIRVQVSSGAHPRFARNPGTGEPLGSATRLVPAAQEIFHDPDHPSAVVLPVVV
jgi:putative CocE/NonD family hydrolase